MPGSGGKPRVHAPPHVPGGDDVEHGQLIDAAGIFQRQAIADPAAPIVAGEAKAVEAERFHDLDHGDRHGTLGVRGVFGIGARRRGPAVTGQICDHQREMRGQRRRHAVPHDVALRMAVQEEKRRAAAVADTGENLADRCVDPARRVAGIKVDEIGHYCASRSTARQPMSWRQKPSGQRTRDTA